MLNYQRVPLFQETAICFLTRKGDDQPLDFVVSLQVVVLLSLKSLGEVWNVTSTYDEDMGKYITCLELTKLDLIFNA
jgi:hypothetical protein